MPNGRMLVCFWTAPGTRVTARPISFACASWSRTDAPMAARSSATMMKRWNILRHRVIGGALGLCLEDNVRQGMTGYKRITRRATTSFSSASAVGSSLRAASRASSVDVACWRRNRLH